MCGFIFYLICFVSVFFTSLYLSYVTRAGIVVMVIAGVGSQDWEYQGSLGQVELAGSHLNSLFTHAIWEFGIFLIHSRMKKDWYQV